MTKSTGGKVVEAGFYWNVKEWEAQIVPREGGVLKGGTDDTYVRLPVLALLVLAPVMGAVYAFFLPFIGFAMLAKYLGGRFIGLFTTKPPATTAGAGETSAREGTKKAA